MTDHATRSAERAASLADDGATWARLASFRARGGDAAGAFAAACTALVRDPRADVRYLLPPPQSPCELGLRRQRTSVAVSPAPSLPVRVGRLVGPPLLGDRVVDLGRGLVAYAAAEGLVGVDLFGGAWRGARASPWAVHAGCLVVIDATSRLRFLDPATGVNVGCPLSAADAGLAPDGTLRCLGLDERHIAVTTSGIGPESLFVVLDVVERSVVERHVVHGGGAGLAVAVDGVLLVDGPRRAPLSREVVATHGGDVAWTTRATLAGTVDGLALVARWPGSDDQGVPALQLLRPTDGAVILTPPVPATRALIPSPGSRELVHALVVGDMIVAETQLGGLNGLDRRTWATIWTWSPGRDRWAPRRAHLLPFTDVAVAVVEHEQNEATQGPGPARRADAVLALDPSTGEERWRIDLSPPVVMAGDPAVVAGRVVIPEWRGTAVMVEGA